MIIRTLRQTVLKAKTEEIFVNLRRRVNFIRRFIPVGLRHKFTSVGRLIPNAAEYPKDDRYSLTRDHTHFIINRSDYVQWRLFYGIRDNALKEAKKHLKDDSIVLDIGANFGAFSLKLARHISDSNYSGIQIHAFEPNPVVSANYQNNLSLNADLKPLVQLHQVGLGNTNEERFFNYADSNTGAGRVVNRSSSLTVRIHRLDDFIAELNPPKISFIKLIVEGFEPEVFKGGWETLKKYRPPIFFEVTKSWWEENNSTIEEVLSKLRELGYRFTIEHHNEMRPYQESKYAHRSQFNLMATIA